MNIARAWLGFGFLSLGVASLLAGCGSDEAAGTPPGAGGGLISGGAGGGVGRTDGGGGAGQNPFLGQGCVNDSECGGDPLICLHQTDAAWGTGGPPQGLCTLPCTTNGTCSDVQEGAGCFKPGADGYCLEGCTPGDTAGAAKCHNRAEFSCQQFSVGTDTVNQCAPACNGDPDCQGGMFCNTGTGFCEKTAQTGDPEGTPCDPMAQTNNCKGICLGLPDADGGFSMGVCADLCSGQAPCLYDSSGMPHGACLGALAATGAALGDFAFCVETCACTSQCNFPGDVCGAWSGTATQVAQITTTYGGPGVCEQPATSTNELKTCTGAGGAASGGGGASGGSSGSAGTAGAATGGAAGAGP
ncbi:MAG TPA: hypothetical protein VGI10_19155 [Polyangiaceae bacterium]